MRNTKGQFTEGCEPYNRKHRLAETKLYKVWNSMKHRCYNETNTRYNRYGNRGIKVCGEWLSDFEVFMTWSILNGYKEGLQLDRIDNNGDYKPENCRFVPSSENSRNRSDTKLNWKTVESIRSDYTKGETSKKQLAILHGVTTQHIHKIVNNKRWKINT